MAFSQSIPGSSHTLLLQRMRRYQGGLDFARVVPRIFTEQRFQVVQLSRPRQFISGNFRTQQFFRGAIIRTDPATCDGLSLPRPTGKQNFGSGYTFRISFLGDWFSPASSQSSVPRFGSGEGFRGLGLGFGVWGWEFGFWVVEFWVWSVRFGVWGFRFEVWGLGFGVWGLGFEVWSLEFRVWGLGFRVKGLGFRFRV